MVIFDDGDDDLSPPLSVDANAHQSSSSSSFIGRFVDMSDWRPATGPTKADILPPPPLPAATTRCRTSSSLLTMVLLLVVVDVAHADTILRGVPAVCDNEGERIDVPLVHGGGCGWACFCKERQIVCEKERCQSSQGCYMVLLEHKRKCCSVCKGCVFNGTSYESGRRWRDPDDPCRTYHCQAGIVTAAREQCFAACADPVSLPGQCCPSCPGCPVGDGYEFVLKDDRCVRCHCNTSRLTCVKPTCPVLSCPASKVVHRADTCCPECSGIREVYDWKRRCLIDNKFYSDGDRFKTDVCTSCVCNGSTSVCERQSCPPLPCPQQSQVTAENSCCSRCQTTVASASATCAASDGTVYQHGETWRPEACTTCGCWQGTSQCLVQQCSGGKLTCPDGYKAMALPNQCCPQCVEEDGVCTVFGDPHYRTFDRRVFHFQGSCKYVLTEDCMARSFSVRVRNDARYSRSFSWTKSVFLKVNGTKVVLLQNMKIRVDGSHVVPPYTKRGVLSVVQEGYSVVVRTELGMSLLWDGDSFLEVSVRPEHRGRLCGLCGNYNGDGADDFRTRQGHLVHSAFKFGSSWRVGGKHHCNRPEAASKEAPLCKASWDSRIRGTKTCNALKSHVFQPCHHVINPNTYLRLCMLDMCECPANKSCYCEVLTAYAHECSRKGVALVWRNATGCTGPPCSKGAVFDPCGSACPTTCENRHIAGLMPCPKACVPGCHCPTGTVLHRKRCIKPKKCPHPTSQSG